MPNVAKYVLAITGKKRPISSNSHDICDLGNVQVLCPENVHQRFLKGILGKNLDCSFVKFCRTRKEPIWQRPYVDLEHG